MHLAMIVSTYLTKGNIESKYFGTELIWGNFNSLAPGVWDVEECARPQCILQRVFVGSKMVVHLNTSGTKTPYKLTGAPCLRQGQPVGGPRQGRCHPQTPPGANSSNSHYQSNDDITSIVWMESEISAQNSSTTKSSFLRANWVSWTFRLSSC